jgi:hypothetical protein
MALPDMNGLRSTCPPPVETESEVELVVVVVIVTPLPTLARSDLRGGR